MKKKSDAGFEAEGKAVTIGGRPAIIYFRLRMPYAEACMIVISYEEGPGPTEINAQLEAIAAKLFSP